MAAITTSELARQGGINLESIRFYEKQGLLPKPPRTTSGYRMFPPDSVSRVRFIKRAQGLGFTLKEIKELLALRLEPDTSCAEVRQRAERKINDIEQKVRDLQRIKRVLTRLVAECSGRGTSAECSVLQAMENARVPKSESRRE